MPDDPDAALIERMLDTYEDAPLDMSDEEAMSRVLDVVREHEGQALAAMTAARDAAQEEADAATMDNEEAQEVEGCLAQELAEARAQIAAAKKGAADAL